MEKLRIDVRPFRNRPAYLVKELSRYFGYGPISCHAILPLMDTDDDQRRDALLLRLLKTPPTPRPKRVRDKPKSTRPRRKGARATKTA